MTNIENIDGILAMMEDMLDAAWSIPLSGGKGAVDIDRLRELIEDLKMHIPVEVSKAKEIVNDRKIILDDAKKEAEMVIRVAEERAKKLVDHDEVVKQARLGLTKFSAHLSSRPGTEKGYQRLCGQRTEIYRRSGGEISGRTPRKTPGNQGRKNQLNEKQKYPGRGTSPSAGIFLNLFPNGAGSLQAGFRCIFARLHTLKLDGDISVITHVFDSSQNLPNVQVSLPQDGPAQHRAADRFKPGAVVAVKKAAYSRKTGFITNIEILQMNHVCIGDAFFYSVFLRARPHKGSYPHLPSFGCSDARQLRSG